MSAATAGVIRVEREVGAGGEGLGLFAAGQRSIEWPGGDAALLIILAGWWLLARTMISVPKTRGASQPSQQGTVA